MKSILVALVLTLASAGTAAGGQTPWARLAPAIAQRVAALGGRATVLEAGDERVVEVTTPQGRFYVDIGPCPRPASCRWLTFRTTLMPATPLPAAALSGWNAREPFARASLTPEGRPHLEMTLILADAPGVEPFDQPYRLWVDAMRRFIAMAYAAPRH